MRMIPIPGFPGIPEYAYAIKKSVDRARITARTLFHRLRRKLGRADPAVMNVAILSSQATLAIKGVRLRRSIPPQRSRCGCDRRIARWVGGSVDAENRGDESKPH